MTLTMKRIKNYQIPDYVVYLSPFNANDKCIGQYATIGNLKQGKLDAVRYAGLLSRVEYYGPGRVFIVYSYETPIAWYRPNIGWTMPTVTYSVTTTKHQVLVKRGIDMSYEEREEPTPESEDDWHEPTDAQMGESWPTNEEDWADND